MESERPTRWLAFYFNRAFYLGLPKYPINVDLGQHWSPLKYTGETFYLLGEVGDFASKE